MKVSTKLSKNKYSFEKEHETHLLIEIEAPKVELHEKRPPICIIPVLDVSGSMYGNKLDYLKKACRKLIEHLSIGDFIGIVAFDTTVYEIAPITEITQYHKGELKDKVSKLVSGSCTNLSGGLLKAFEWINNIKLPSNTILRIVIFTDGQANVGITESNLVNFVKEMKGKASVSCFGLGDDCSHSILTDMSAVAQGNYAFIDSPDAALSAFGRELGGLIATWAQNIKINIIPNTNNSIIEILNDEDVDEKEGNVLIGLRDLLEQEKKWIIAKVKIGNMEKPLPRKISVFKINISYQDLKGNLITIPEQSIKIEFCKVGEEPEKEDPEVVKHRDRLVVAKAMDKAEYCVRMGDYSGAVFTMNNCRGNISDVDMGHLVEASVANYSCSSNYSSKKGFTNSTRSILKGKRLSNTSKEVEDLFISTPDAEYMTNMVDSFKEDEKDVIITSADLLIDSINGTSDKVELNPVVDNSSTKKKSKLDW